MKRQSHNAAIWLAAFNKIHLGWIAEHRFYGPRRWRFDFANPDKKLAVEIEGGIFSRGRHTRGAGYLKDLEKYNRAAILGWAVLRYAPWQLAEALTDLQEIP